MNNYEYLFNQDIMEKKLAARGASHKASRKKGFKGGVRTEYDYMTAKQRRKLNGEVRCYIMEKTILTYAEFKSLPKTEKTEILTAYLSDYTKEELAGKWDISVQNVRNLFYRHANKGDGENIKMVTGTMPNKSQQIIKIDEDIRETVPEVLATVPKSFVLKLNGNMSGAEIKEEIINLASILRDDKLYQLLLSIEAD